MKPPCIRLTLALAATLVACAGPGRAIPSAALSTIPSHVLMVGRSGSLADTSLGMFLIVVRDAANSPVVSRTVEFRVLNCEGARLSTDALQPGVGTNCATHGITAVTDAAGIVRMTVVGGGTPGSPPGTGPCAQVYAAGVFLGMVSVGVLDLDGSRGLAINDLSLWLADLGLSEPISRSDYNGDGAVTVSDLSIWLTAWARAGSVESAPAYCP